MKRCFVALEIPEKVKSVIDEVEKNFSREVTHIASLKFVKKENLHITLKFLGNVNDGLVDNIENKLHSVLSGKREISCELHTRLGVFPSEDRIRVVWVGVESNGEIEKLMREVDVNLMEFGFKKEKNYTPHITIARVKSIGDKKAMKSRIECVKIPEVKFSIKRAVLYESVLMPEGPVYKVLKDYVLE